MFQAIASSNFTVLLQLGKILHTEFNDIPSSLLCFDHVFIRPFKFQNLTCSEISETLKAFLIYAEELRKISFHYEGHNDLNIQRLFGFQTSEEQIITIPISSYMYPFVSNSRGLRTQESTFVTMTSHDFMLSFPQALRNRLQARVHAEDAELSLSKILHPCLVHAVYGECNTFDCDTRRVHVNKESMTADWYNARIRIVFQQIQICQTLISIQRRWNQDQQRE